VLTALDPESDDFPDLDLDLQPPFRLTDLGLPRGHVLELPAVSGPPALAHDFDCIYL
jgi:hypothetical protein